VADGALKSLRHGLIAGVLGLAFGLAALAQTASPEEEAVFRHAQTTGLFSDYEAYLAQYPTGAFAEAARFEMQWALKSTQSAEAQTDIRFDTPLISDTPAVHGKSIEMLILGSPLYSPIEGLPEALWKEAVCSDCHGWTKEALCDQGMVYTGIQQSKSLTKEHPYGGAMKAALRTFAVEGCR
jgi:uncharacterized caspase-like protein